MSAKFKLKNRDSWKVYPLSGLYTDRILRDDFLTLFPEITEEFLLESQSFAKDLNFEFVAEENVLGLRKMNENIVHIDLELSWNYHKDFYSKHGFKNEAFYKAIKNDDFEIIDATAGLLGDSTLMAFWGFKVDAFEANPLVSCLIFNALNRFPLPQYSFHPKEFSGQLTQKTIYYDPFFRKEKEKTSPKKGIKLLREFDLFSILDLRTGEYPKVVVKRPRGAELIWDNPHRHYESKSVRFDIYMPN